MQTLDRPHRAPAQPLPPHAADCHIGFHARQQVHDAELLAHREFDAGAILVHNPERLYGF